MEELYKQLVYALHLAVNCNESTSEIVQLIGKAVEICREAMNHRQEEEQ